MEPKSKITIHHGTLNDIEFPPILYKYRNWSDNFHKRFIVQREVFMASARSFTDKLDCNNSTRFDLLDDQQIYQYYRHWSEKEHPNWKKFQHKDFARKWTKQTPIKDKNHVEEWMKKTREEYYDHDGILSLTANCDNERMWKEYGNVDKGFCIGYNTKELFKYVGGGGEVLYLDELPMILPEPFMEFPEAMRNRVYCKLKEFEFEEEYRTRKFSPNTLTVEERRIELPPTAFNRIILGKKMTDADKKEIKEYIKSHIGEIQIVEKSLT